MPEDLKQAAVDAHSARESIMKATVISARGTSNVQAHPDEADTRWEGVGAIMPPYDPSTLLLLLEHSNALRQCIDAYVTNIDAFGHHFEPIVDLEAADANDRLTSYIMSRRLARNATIVDDPNAQVALPTEEELERAKKELTEKMRSEKMKINHFFDFACLDISFVTLRRRTRQDLEQIGNAYWEVQRSQDGKIAGFDYVPSYTVRHMHQSKVPTCVQYKVKVNEFDYEDLQAKRFFRLFIQLYETRVTYFKELGDPRYVSALSGAAYPDKESWDKHLADTPDDTLATEMIHFRIHTPKSSYGIPRWIGTILSVLGSRQAEEVNLSYFENKSVPPLAILVQGGRMASESIERVKDFIENDIKGKKNFHKILVLEAESQGAGSFEQGKMKIDIKPLTAAQHNDALFQNYDERNIDKVGMSFRLPRMLRGDIRDFNRATAEAALQFAESQVFGPERDEFDFTMNRKILPLLGVKFWKFKSHTASATNPQDLSEMINKLSTVGVLTPAEGRELAEKVFNRELRKIDEPWVRQPIELTKAGVAAPDAPGTKPAATGAPSPASATDTPLGGAHAGTGGPAIATGAAPATLTGTDIATVITVNEARADMGKGPLTLPNSSTPDPDGWLTVTEFKAKRIAAGQVLGTDEGQAESGSTTTPSNAGAGAPQGKRAIPHGKSEILSLAADLLTLRKTMGDLEVAEVEEQFRANLANHKVLEAEDELLIDPEHTK